MQYPDYKSLKLDWPAEHVLRITMSRGKVNAMDYDLHHDIAQIWRLIDRDPDVNCAIVTGEGTYFSAGGDFAVDGRIAGDFDFMIEMMKDAREIVENMMTCSKPIISAINGPAAGGGLAVALMADISIGAKSAKLVDAHTRLGVAAGDHAALIWPLMCGMAKSKLYLFTCDPLSAEEAERIGLLSMCVDDDKLMETAVALAARLAMGAPTGIRWTKNVMNQWYRQAWPIFEASVAYENLGFFGPDLPEGMQSHVEKREPKFNPRSPL
ncbi:enoyl-CoA hydratase [Rhizobium aquaticum]|uniref:Enoyl-CoA hydratase n=1 Tax=Rhizobium aquaticum TaxID=1549636 RepID=A0ABV2J690_9HYPH